jgi:hypothetical protein
MKRKMLKKNYGWLLGVALTISSLNLVAQEGNEPESITPPDANDEFVVVQDSKNRFLSWFGCAPKEGYTCVIRANKPIKVGK